MSPSYKKVDHLPGLPGMLDENEYLQQVIRVNHAGEYGAKRIYHGQMHVLKNHACYPVLKHMAEQEEEHLEYFSRQLEERNIRPSALMPLWHIAGYTLGAATALLGKEAAMACTVAVEEAIDEHYREQLDRIDEKESDLKEKIETFRLQELEHKEIGIEHEAKKAVAYPVLKFLIKTGSRVAITLAKKV